MFFPCDDGESEYISLYHYWMLLNRKINVFVTCESRNSYQKLKNCVKKTELKIKTWTRKPLSTGSQTTQVKDVYFLCGRSSRGQPWVTCNLWWSWEEKRPLGPGFVDHLSWGVSDRQQPGRHNPRGIPTSKKISNVLNLVLLSSLHTPLPHIPKWATRGTL